MEDQDEYEMIVEEQRLMADGCLRIMWVLIGVMVLGIILIAVCA
jgi:hypothetical protein